MFDTTPKFIPRIAAMSIVRNLRNHRVIQRLKGAPEMGTNDSNASAHGATGRKAAAKGRAEREMTVVAADRKGIRGVPGSKNDSRRCSATANRTGERCKAPAVMGTTVCRMHGGALPSVKKKAKERLMELVDPALASLHKVLTDENADDSTKVRAALGILDRTGHGPGQKIEIGVTKWDTLLEEASPGQFDRSLPDGPTTPTSLPSAASGDHTWEDVAQAQSDASAEAWRELDDDDAREYEARPNFRTSDTVRGEATVNEDTILPKQPDTRTGPSEYGGDPTAWPYGDRRPAP